MQIVHCKCKPTSYYNYYNQFTWLSGTNYSYVIISVNSVTDVTGILLTHSSEICVNQKHKHIDANNKN